MRAAFLTDQRRFELRHVPLPTAGPGEALIDVHACGICGSDVHFFVGGSPPPRVCPGHEIAGRIVTAVGGLRAGDPVVVEPLRSCGSCASCRAGEPNLCPQVEILGSRLPGGFAEAVVVPATSIHPLPRDLDLSLATLVEPLAVAVHAVGLAASEPGRTIMVLGGGTIGLLTAFVAARAGCAVTIAVRHEHQRRAALRLGAARVVSGDRTGVLDAAAMQPPDVVFEAVGGRSDTLDMALAAVRPGGTIVTLGLFTQPIVLHPIRFLAKEVHLVSSMMYSRKGRVADFVTAIDLLSHGREELATLITHHVPLAAIEEGFTLASDKSSGAIKVRVDVA
ncbi:MAG: alcohol dehydrogenase catalytic domain-containing protein [Candidatus Binatia bacterium]